LSCHYGVVTSSALGLEDADVALDSNILIDVYEHGQALIGRGFPDAGFAQNRDDEMFELARLPDLWLSRDITVRPARALIN
jgi:hypothetical protein